MNVLKNLALSLALALLILNAFDSNGQNVVFFKDTVFETNGLKVKIETGFRKEEVIKLSSIFTNLTDNYIFLNPKDVSITTEQGEDVFPTLKKLIIVPPKDAVKVRLVFRFTGRVSYLPLSVNLKKITGTDIVKNRGVISLISKRKTMIEDSTLSIEVLDVIPKRKKYFVSVAVKYSGQNYLLTDYKKALLTKSSKENLSNIGRGEVYYNKSKPRQITLLYFPCVSRIRSKNQASIDLSNVFYECSIKKTGACSFKLSLINGSSGGKDHTQRNGEAIKEIE